MKVFKFKYLLKAWWLFAIMVAKITKVDVIGMFFI